jgi:hypothetical protein
MKKAALAAAAIAAVAGIAVVAVVAWILRDDPAEFADHDQGAGR